MGKRYRASEILPGEGHLPQRQAGLPADIDSKAALRAAQSNCTLLITGETGAGKGHLARWLHENSSRADGPFVPVNCGAIPETLIDSQLFGHAKGAFSGATSDHLGLVRAAEHGTLLLDEVSQLPPSAQNRLLRMLHDREVQPVGHSRPVLVDVRVIAATNVDLGAAVANGAFREDLLFRLDVIQLRVAPLRERLHDLSRLLKQFNREYAELYRQEELEFEPSALKAMHEYRWPGNIRQLRTVVERLHVLCPGQRITTEHVVEVGQLSAPGGAGAGMMGLQRIKLEQVRKALAESGGSISRVAEVFGVHRSTIYRWLRGQ
ncbi:MAG: sigma-54 dependent transcriptional regulator [Phycisphaerales bacterium]|nr:sigma-54 dependent transcriptional regulator [Phycisphaerales bacterium]MCI0675488.1 sigma-54 dependent transcriptional regulator [Phycisphaerales bacterium]